MRPLLTADILNTCSQEYEGKEEEMNTVIEKIFKKLSSFTTFVELHFTVRCVQLSCISLHNIYTYVFTALKLCTEYPDCTVGCMVRVPSVYMSTYILASMSKAILLCSWKN